MSTRVEPSTKMVSQLIKTCQPRFSSTFIQGSYVTLGLVAAFWWVWLLLAQMNFNYELWYQWLDIRELIAEVGPENEYKLGLDKCSAAQHAQLFSEIVSMIHQPDGKGLATIRYCSEQGDTLLRSKEIEHLQDVAHLIEGFRYAGWLSTFCWCFALLALYLRA
jgi:hypothetical protein